MQAGIQSVIIATTVDGVLICPDCGKPIRGVRVEVESSAHALPVFCRYCKSEYKIDIDTTEGQRRIKGQRR